MFRSRKLSYSYPLTTGQFNADYADLPLKKLLVNIPITQTGSGTPSPTNIRDFVGFTGAVIGQTSDYGKYFRGLLNGTYGFVDLGSLTFGYNTTYSAFYASVPNIYRPSDVAGRIIGFINLRYPASTNGAISAMDDKSCLRYNGNFWIKDTSFTDATALKTSLNGVYLIYELAEPSTPVTPQEFAILCQDFGITGNIYQITFGQTVYSAILDVLTGKLSITHEIVDLGDLEWNKYGTDKFYTTISDLKLPTTVAERNQGMWCSIYKPSTGYSLGDMSDKSFLKFNQNENFWIYDSDYTDATAFKTAMNGVRLVYELAEPIEIPLGGINIKTLQGTNNIFADVGTVETQCIKLGS